MVEPVTIALGIAAGTSAAGYFNGVDKAIEARYAYIYPEGKEINTVDQISTVRQTLRLSPWAYTSYIIAKGSHGLLPFLTFTPLTLSLFLYPISEWIGALSSRNWHYYTLWKFNDTVSSQYKHENSEYNREGLNSYYQPSSYDVYSKNEEDNQKYSEKEVQAKINLFQQTANHFYSVEKASSREQVIYLRKSDTPSDHSRSIYKVTLYHGNHGQLNMKFEEIEKSGYFKNLPKKLRYVYTRIIGAMSGNLHYFGSEENPTPKEFTTFLNQMSGKNGTSGYFSDIVVHYETDNDLPEFIRDEKFLLDQSKPYLSKLVQSKKNLLFVSRLGKKETSPFVPRKTFYSSDGCAIDLSFERFDRGGNYHFNVRKQSWLERISTFIGYHKAHEDKDLSQQIKSFIENDQKTLQEFNGSLENSSFYHGPNSMHVSFKYAEKSLSAQNRARWLSNDLKSHDQGRNVNLYYTKEYDKAPSNTQINDMIQVIKEDSHLRSRNDQYAHHVVLNYLHRSETLSSWKFAKKFSYDMSLFVRANFYSLLTTDSFSRTSKNILFTGPMFLVNLFFMPAIYYSAMKRQHRQVYMSPHGLDYNHKPLAPSSRLRPSEEIDLRDKLDFGTLRLSKSTESLTSQESLSLISKDSNLLHVELNLLANNNIDDEAYKEKTSMKISSSSRISNRVVSLLVSRKASNMLMSVRKVLMSLSQEQNPKQEMKCRNFSLFRALRK